MTARIYSFPGRQRGEMTPFAWANLAIWTLAAIVLFFVLRASGVIS